MKFNHLIFILIVLVASFKSFATTVAETNSAMDPLNSALANEKLEEDEVAAIDEEQSKEYSEGYFERSNDPIRTGSEVTESADKAIIENESDDDM